jgi:hypothetical protein
MSENQDAKRHGGSRRFGEQGLRQVTQPGAEPLGDPVGV